MLENIQRGDICIFSNGERRAVLKYDRFNGGKIRVYFDNRIASQLTEDTVQSHDWNYFMSGRIIGLSYPNNIEKVVKAS